MLGGTLLLSHRRIRTAAFAWQIWPPKSLLLPSPVSSPLPALGPTFCPLLTASGLTFHCFLSSPVSSILDPGGSWSDISEAWIGACHAPLIILQAAHGSWDKS